MTPATPNVLVIGYGNPGRLDDGLGPAFIAALEQANLPGVAVSTDYQLNVEDAADLVGIDVVLFADADCAGPEPFSVQPVVPATETLSFSTHSVSPEAVLAMARDIFNAEPDAFILGIRGYEFNEFGERLSDPAAANLAAAVQYVINCLKQGRIEITRSADVEHAS